MPAKTQNQFPARALFGQLHEFQAHRNCPTCDVPLRAVATVRKCPTCGYTKNTPPEAGMVEGRDDAGKLPLGKAGHAYSRITSKDVMHQPGGTSDKWRKNLALRKEVTGQQHVSNSKGSTVFPSMDKAGKVPRALKDSLTPAQLVRALLA